MSAITSWSRQLACRFCICCIILTPTAAIAQLDTGNNGMSDVWERHFNDGNLFDPANPDHAPNADPDGDGWTNLEESYAGTDPFSGNPPDGIVTTYITHLKDLQDDPPNGPVIDRAIISWDTLPGKQYTLEASPDLTGASWVEIDAPHYGDGLPAALSITLTDSVGIAPDKLFWRVLVTDLDSDGDGLTDHEEFMLGTNPHHPDSDGDGLSDYQEMLYGTDPLNTDTDGDGLSDFDELAYGTDPLNTDSDGDGLSDGYEVANGSDPLDSESAPFTPSAHFGPVISDEDVQPMGDLGTDMYGNGSAHKVSFGLKDDSIFFEGIGWISNQEGWQLKIGDNMAVTTIPFRRYFANGGFLEAYSNNQTLQLDKKKTYEVRLEHLGLAGVDRNGILTTPDFRHQWSMSSNDFLYLTNDPNLAVRSGFDVGRKTTTGVLPANYDWTTRINYLVPIVRLGYSTSYTGSDATGPRFRRISLLGRPIPDVKPESESESDEAAEESYIDAFDLSLRHDTSFASIPLAASDLRLEASASVRESSWSNRGGLRPEEDITSPFGISWTSNLCAYIETVETFGSSTTRPTTVNVIDEGGRSQRFGTTDDMETFFPWPSSLTDKKTYLNTLSVDGDDLVLQKKFGNKLTYRSCDAWFMLPADRLENSPTVIRHRYWRLVEVEDRFGAKVEYDYGNNPYSLIPVEIRAVGRPNQKITIVRSVNGRRVNSITDALGNVTQFHYTARTIDVPFSTLVFSYQELSKVTFPGGAEEQYAYEVVSDVESIPNRITYHFHANLKSMQRDGYDEKVFHYAYDRSRKWYDHSLGRFAISASLAALPPEIATKARDYVKSANKTPQTGSNLRIQYGVPRLISSVEWPVMGIESSFAKTTGTQATYGPVFSSTNGTEVTDAEGMRYTYLFGGTHGEIIDSDTSQTDGTTSVSTQWLVYHTTTTLQYKDASGTLLGSETYEFDPDSGLSLIRAVDFSGNETVWDFEEVRPGGPRITLEDKPDFFTNWADPTRKTDALGRIENYVYGHHRMMTLRTDVHGTDTETIVDTLGRRTEMTVRDLNQTLLQKETYEYDNTQFPGFMTRMTRVAFANPSGQAWEQDLVVEYVPDTRGRLWKEITDPAGENLQTVHTYDLNNRKITTTDPNGNTTTFDYDDRGRLIKTTFADTHFKTYAYDDNNAKIRETDENGNSTLIERDGIGRITRTARDLDGDGLIGTGDIITQFAYNDLGLLRKQIDPRGIASVTFYDTLHRAHHIFHGVPAADADNDLAALTTLAASSRQITHQEYSYVIADHPGGGMLQPFQPTAVTRHHAVSSEPGQPDATLVSTTTFDEVYRPLESSAEYAPGSSSLTQINYGTIDTSGIETLVTTITDTLGKTTRITRDALGREIETIDGFGNTDPQLVLTATQHYTSTGLLWRTIDPLLRHSETEYDNAGRPIKTYQPDPATGLITANSPIITTEYDANSNIIATLDPLGHRTDIDHDNRNRKWRVRQPAVTDATNPDAPVTNVRPTTTIEFDPVGNQIAISDPRGATTRQFHDRANRMVNIRTNPQTGTPSADISTPGAHDITTTTEYDPGSLAIAVTDGNGNITRNAYDNLGRLIATVCDAATGDPAALPMSGLDPPAYRLANPTSALVTHQHDDAGNVIQVTDGKGQNTAFTFDGFQRKTRVIWDPSTAVERTETHTFNALHQTSRTDGKGHLTTYQYDSLHRLIEVFYRPDISTTHIDNRHIAYDKAGRVLAITHPNDPGSLRETASTYDKLDRLTSETSAGVTHTHTEYDKAGNRKQTTYGHTGTTLVSTYDAHHRLATLTEGTHITTYAYDRGGNITRKTLPNGNASTTSRDMLGRTLLIEERTSTNTLISSFDYSQPVSPWPNSHDGVGNVLRCAETHTMPGMTNRVVANSYDACNRLHTETITPSGGTATTTEYGYDLADNRTTKVIGTATTEYQFGNGTNGYNSNQLIAYGPSGQTATHSFTYDFNGNRETRITAAGTETYTWNHENRLTALATPTGDHAYTYDPRGRRVIRDESAANGVLTELTYSGGTSVQEADALGSVTVETIRGSDWGGGIGGILYTIRGTARSYNTYNSRGDVVSVSNDTGTATWQAAYEAFGTRTEEDGTNTERQRANTKEEDPTGLLNEGHRYRDLEAGVFISRDPLGFVDGPNVYAYVRQNPWSAFDPLGLVEKKIGEVYVIVNHSTKQFYVGETGRQGEMRIRDTKHRKAQNLTAQKGTLFSVRSIVADDQNPEKMTARAQRMVVEREVYDDAKKAWGSKGYTSLNDEKQLLSDKKYTNAKRTTNPRFKPHEKPRKYEAGKGLLGIRNEIKPLPSGRAGFIRGLTLGGVGGVAGIAAMYSNEDDIGVLLTTWASDPWNNTHLENNIAQEIGGHLGTPGYVSVGAALQAAREKTNKN